MIITNESKLIDNGRYSQPFQPAVELPEVIDTFINILFTDSKDGTSTIKRSVNDILNIVVETELESFLKEKFGFIFTVDDSAITDFNSLVNLERAILIDLGFVARLLTEYRKILDSELEREMLATLQSIFEDHYNTVWRLSSLIIIHMLALDKKLS